MMFFPQGHAVKVMDGHEGDQRWTRSDGRNNQYRGSSVLHTRWEGPRVL